MKKLNKKVISDCELLSVILQRPNIRARARFIQRFLRPSDQHRLCEHIGKILQLEPPPSHRLKDANSLDTVRNVLQPHKKIVNRIVRNSHKKGRKSFELTRQRGGALFSVILAAAIPLIADLILRATAGKK